MFWWMLVLKVLGKNVFLWTIFVLRWDKRFQMRNPRAECTVVERNPNFFLSTTLYPRKLLRENEQRTGTRENVVKKREIMNWGCEKNYWYERRNLIKRRQPRLTYPRRKTFEKNFTVIPPLLLVEFHFLINIQMSSHLF